eukprot:Platyproteum_vivax@DN15842_c0_g1_i1.p1
MLFRSAIRCGPPKQPRNVFFPWCTFTLNRCGLWQEPNQIAFRVPIHLTKPEIREYLRKIYGAKVIRVNTYIMIPGLVRSRSKFNNMVRRVLPYKKAFVTLEHEVPPEIRMMATSLNIGRNPIMLGPTGMKNQKSGWRFPWATRHRLLRTLGGAYRKHEDWRHPITTLLRGDEFPAPILKNQNQFDQIMPPDPTKPHHHYLHAPVIAPGVPDQPLVQMDLRTFRRDMVIKRRAKILYRGPKPETIEETSMLARRGLRPHKVPTKRFDPRKV